MVIVDSNSNSRTFNSAERIAPTNNGLGLVLLVLLVLLVVLVLLLVLLLMLLVLLGVHFRHASVLHLSLLTY